jgi:hypothetical protein
MLQRVELESFLIVFASLERAMIDPLINQTGPDKPGSVAYVKRYATYRQRRFI